MKLTHILLIALVAIVLGLILMNTDSKTDEPEAADTATTIESSREAASVSESPEVNGTGEDALQEAASGEAKVFNVSGTNFVFDVAEMRVKEGDTVTINFTSADGFHDLVIDEFNVRTEKLRAVNTGTVTFVADKKGTFEYYCSVGQHRMNGMVGTLIVE